MITIISATNRKDSKTVRVAEHIQRMISQHTDEEIQLLDLASIPIEVYHADMYDGTQMAQHLIDVQEGMIIPSRGLIVVAPEYNGSIPGIFKLFVDAISVRKYKENFSETKACLVGVASGRAGNLRGLEHTTGFLHYLGVDVMPQKLPISSIGSEYVDGVFSDNTQEAIGKQLETFVKYLG